MEDDGDVTKGAVCRCADFRLASAKRDRSLHISWPGDGLPIGICGALLLADCNGSDRQMKHYKFTTCQC